MAPPAMVWPIRTTARASRITPSGRRFRSCTSTASSSAARTSCARCISPASCRNSSENKQAHRKGLAVAPALFCFSGWTVPTIMDRAESHQQIRAAVRDLCSRFPGEYWRKLDEARAYPEEFVRALTDAGWLSALIPEEYGGAGLSLGAASVILEEINASGGNAGACHAQMYTMGTLLRHGSPEQKQRYLPRIAAGELRL